jgi:hypothetical protein
MAMQRRLYTTRMAMGRTSFPSDSNGRINAGLRRSASPRSVNYTNLNCRLPTGDPPRHGPQDRFLCPHRSHHRAQGSYPRFFPWALPRRPLSGDFTCCLTRKYHLLTTGTNISVVTLERGWHNVVF